MDIHALLDTITAAEREAAELMLSATQILGENKSSRRDVVTQYDRRVQDLLMTRLRAAVPDACFYCEENEQREDLTAEHVFIIDPIDGTMNFVHGYNLSCISVAYASHGTVQAGAVYNPYLREMFTAIRGEGAYCNGKRLHVAEEGLAQNICCAGTAPYHPEMTDVTFTQMRKVFNASLDIRRSGSAALDLCSVAAGRAGLYFEESLCLWDHAAGGLCVTEAGGVLSRMDGSPLTITGGTTSIVAGGQKCFEEYFRL